MPIYEYRCRRCGETFEKLRSMKDADKSLRCPKCNAEEVERQLSGFATGGCGPRGSRGFT